MFWGEEMAMADQMEEVCYESKIMHLDKAEGMEEVKTSTQ